MFWIETCAEQQIQIEDLSKKGRLLRFESNSTATLDGVPKRAQKIGNDVWHDSESITTKVYSPIGRSQMKNNAWKQCND